MVTSLKQKAAIGAAGVALLAGAGGAYAATRSTATPGPAKHRAQITAQRNAFLDDVATRLGTTRDKLEAALKGAAVDRIDAAVAAGKLTKAQGDKIKQRIQAGNGPFLGLGPAFQVVRPGHRGFGFGFRLGFGPGRSLDAAAHYLGLTDKQLRTQLRSGKTLAQLAKSKGKSLSGLESAIRGAVKTRLDKMVANKRITAAQRDQFLKQFDQTLPNLVNGSLPAGPQFRHFGHP
jgi:hypothetical protein